MSDNDRPQPDKDVGWIYPGLYGLGNWFLNKVIVVWFKGDMRNYDTALVWTWGLEVVICGAVGYRAAVPSELLLIPAAARLLYLYAFAFFTLIVGYPAHTSHGHRRGFLIASINFIEVPVLFGLMFYLTSTHWSEFWRIEKCLSLGDAIYFSFVSATTLGYGEITPKGTGAKILVVIEVVGIVILFLGWIALFIGNSTIAAGSVRKDG